MASAGTYTLQYDVASAGAFRRAPRVTSATSDPGDPTSDRSPNLVNFQYEIHPHRPPTQTFPRARDLPRAPRFVARPTVPTVTTANMSTAVWTRHTHSNGRCWCEFRVTWRYTSCFDETLGDSLNSVPSTTFDDPNLGEGGPKLGLTKPYDIDAHSPRDAASALNTTCPV